MANFKPEKLHFDEDGFHEFKELRKWTNFLSVCGFIFVGLLLISATVYFISISMNFDALEVATLQVAPLVLLAAIYFVPVYYLFKFARYSKAAIKSADNISLNIAFRYLNLHYRYMSILLIIVMLFYLLIGVFMLIRGELFQYRM